MKIEFISEAGSIYGKPKRVQSCSGGILLADYSDSAGDTTQFYYDDGQHPSAAKCDEIIVGMYLFRAESEEDGSPVDLVRVSVTVNGRPRANYDRFFPRMAEAKRAFHAIRNACITGADKTGDLEMIRKTVLPKVIKSQGLTDDIKKAKEEISDWFGADLTNFDYR